MFNDSPRLSHEDSPQEERLVYALLDTQSHTTFILEKTANEMGLNRTDVKLILSTMYEENQMVDSSKFKELQIRG